MNKDLRLEGVITELSTEIIIIKDLLTQEEYISESFNKEFKIRDKVTFVHIDGIASDVIAI